MTASRCICARVFRRDPNSRMENARRSGDEVQGEHLNRWPWRVESFKRAEWSMFRGPSESRSHGRPNCIQTLPIKLARSLENLQSAARSLAPTSRFLSRERLNPDSRLDLRISQSSVRAKKSIIVTDDVNQHAINAYLNSFLYIFSELLCCLLISFFFCFFIFEISH